MLQDSPQNLSFLQSFNLEAQVSQLGAGLPPRPAGHGHEGGDSEGA